MNQQKARAANRAALLKLMNSRGQIARRDIARELRLTPAAVSVICGELIGSGILRECGQQAGGNRAGRRTVPLGLDPGYKKILTVSFEADGTALSVCDICGGRLASEVFPTGRDAGPGDFIGAVITRAQALLKRCGVGQGSLLGVGVSVPGPVDKDSGTSLRAYRIWDHPVPLGRYFSDVFGPNVVVVNNVKAFAAGELISGEGRSCGNLLVLKWGPGVGSAVINDGRLLGGDSLRAAEIGHCIVKPDGAQCRCGRRGCLETLVATHPLARSVREVYSRKATPELYRATGGDAGAIRADNPSLWLGSPDEPVAAIRRRACGLLALAAVNAASLVSPEKTVVYGSLFETADMFSLFLARCAQLDPGFAGNKCAMSGIRGKEQYIGPLAAVLDRYLWAPEGAES